MFREIREIREIKKEDEKKKEFMKIKPSKDFNMSIEECEAFWMAEMMKVGEES